MKLIRNSVSALTGGAFVATTVALGLLILNTQLSIPDEWIATTRCALGVPAKDSACVADAIKAADDARFAANAARQLAEDALAGQNLVFTQGDPIKDGVSVVVGTIYQNAAARSGIIRSFCWAIIDSSGLDPRVGLAVRDGNGQIEAIDLSASDRDQLDVSLSDIDAARQNCPWPGGVN